MNKKKMTSVVVASVLTLMMGFASTISFAQATHHHHHQAAMKDCCMMKDGKMMVMKNGKTMPMEEDMTMKNGTKCMTTGECTMKGGKKMQMKEGQCMDMQGKMGDCGMMMKSSKKTGGTK